MHASNPPSKLFDNVLVRRRGSRCIVGSTLPPFVAAYWQQISGVLKELGIQNADEASLDELQIQEEFLAALSSRVSGAERFKPAKIGCDLRSQEMRAFQEARAARCLITLLGKCPREVILGALEAATARIRGKAMIEVRIKGWDTIGCWQEARTRVEEILNYLYSTKSCHGSLLLFSELKEVPQGLWDYIYERPRVRVGWVATELAECRAVPQLEHLKVSCAAFTNLEMLANTGIWPHVVLPVTAANVGILPPLAVALANSTRGGTLDLVAAPLLCEDIPSAPPSVHDYTAALLAIYREGLVPLRKVSPLSWVAARVDADLPLPSSTETVGAALVVLPTGEVYPAEAAVGSSAWCLGNVLNGAASLHWERSDALAEMSAGSMKPAACRNCDWRYRCGGIDANVSLLKARRQADSAESQQALADFYCEPRKALFEAAFWDSTVSSAGKATRPSREILKLHATGLEFKPATPTV